MRPRFGSASIPISQLEANLAPTAREALQDILSRECTFFRRWRGRG